MNLSSVAVTSLGLAEGAAAALAELDEVGVAKAVEPDPPAEEALARAVLLVRRLGCLLMLSLIHI